MNRIPVSTKQNRWHDAQRIDKSDLDIEQEYNNQINAAIVNNFFGSGVLPESPGKPYLFDSDNLTSVQAALLAAGNLDGTGLDAHNQPSDINLGNQLTVELSGSDAFGRLSVKVLIVGLSFDNELQYDRFYFYRNEKQTTSKHYKRILTIIFNDFKGNNNCSRNLGGRITISEAAPFELSRDPIMVSQDVEPNIFFRDFKVANSATGLYNTIQNGIGSEYNADNLNINVTGKPARTIEPLDVTTQIGQKFLATTDNIQKITLLLGVIRDEEASIEDRFNWDGDLIVSIYPLQTNVNSPSDIVPELAIDFDPAQTPLAEVSFSYDELKDLGYVLTDIAQPIDFVFNATKVANVGALVPGRYYAFTFRRSGATNTGTIFAETGNDHVSNSRLTIFSGVWVDVNEEDLWFQIWTDAAKVADGQGYDSGHGIRFAKTTIDTTTGATVDNEQRHFSFASTGQNTVNTAVLQAQVEESVSTQDERTGNNVFSRKEFVPSFSFVNSSGLAELKETSDPLILGCIVDTNPKLNSTITQLQAIPGLVKGDTFCVVNPDPDLLSSMLIGSKLIPNNNCDLTSYKIFKVEVCTDGYGDTNGDGYIDSSDVQRASQLIGESVYLNSTQQKIVDGEIDTLELLRADVDGDGYVTVNDVDLIQDFVNKSINSFPAGTSFTRLCITVQQNIGRYDGYHDCDGLVRIDGYTTNYVNPNTLSGIELIYDGYLADVSIDGSDTAFTTIPFVPVEFLIEPQPFWQPHFLNLSSKARMLPAAFTFSEGVEENSCTAESNFTCENRTEITPTCDPGRNDLFVPDNLIMGNGNIIRVDGSIYKPDFEIGTIILELPELPIEHKSLNIFDAFVANRGDGKTSSAYNAMRYFDCSFVEPEDINLDRVRFNVSIQSIAKNIDGYEDEDGYGLIIPENLISIYIDQSTGIMTLYCTDIELSSIYRALRTKIQIVVYLKKSGFNNRVLTIPGDEVSGLFNLS